MAFPKTREEMKEQGYQFIGSKKCDAKKCAADLEMYRTPNGAAIPMNATGDFIAHFATCPARLRFMRLHSKKSAKQKPKTPKSGDLF